MDYKDLGISIDENKCECVVWGSGKYRGEGRQCYSKKYNNTLYCKKHENIENRECGTIYNIIEKPIIGTKKEPHTWNVNKNKNKETSDNESVSSEVISDTSSIEDIMSCDSNTNSDTEKIELELSDSVEEENCDEKEVEDVEDVIENMICNIEKDDKKGKEVLELMEKLKNINKENDIYEEIDKCVNGVVETNNKFNMIDLFAGTGAFSTAFSKYNVDCVFANDFCNNSEKIFNLNHNIKLLNKDLINIKNEDIPKHNILCGGFPCQPFSIAGLQEGFNDERSNVFWKILSIIKYHSPEIVILENVKNLQAHDETKTFKTIYNELSKLDYFIHHDILNTSKITKIPQNRERIYIVCFKNKELYEKFNYDFPNIDNIEIKDCLEKNIDDKYYYSDRFKVYPAIEEGVTKHINENVIYQYRRYYVRENKNNVCPTLTANMGGGGHNVPLLMDDKGIRRLTPRECFNLQGFPQDYKLPSDLCDSKLYKLAGNAVSVPVVELIAEKISKLIHL